MTTEPTIKFYAMTAEAAEAELGLSPSNPADKFVIVEFWVEADQYDFGAAFRTQADLEAAMKGEAYNWY
ncbi:MAG: hypothetical protein ACO3AD_18775 [Burkholderiaceae bacterium]